MSWVEVQNLKDKITTLSNSTLFLKADSKYANQSVLVKRYDRDYMTVTLDSLGEAEIELAPKGKYEVVLTDEDDTTSTGVFNVGAGKYITMNLTDDSTSRKVIIETDNNVFFNNQSFTLKNSRGEILKEIIFSSSEEEVSFRVQPGTYTLSVTVGGNTYKSEFTILETSEITDVKTVKFYEDGFDFRTWLEKGGLSASSFASFSSVLDSEVTVRRLMTIHASADFLVDAMLESTKLQSTIIGNDTAMKWIGLRDYICDKLMADSDIQSAMLASDSWERILKDHVPTMTSDSAPYGTIIYSSQASSGDHNALTCFDGSENSGWLANNEFINCYIGYKFATPICIKYLELQNYVNSRYRTSGFTLQASNNNSDWFDLYSDSLESVNYAQRFHIDNNTHYLYYRVYCTSNFTGTSFSAGFRTVQFYGRSLNVSVPTMLSNTSPFGTVLYDGYYKDAYRPFYAFDNNSCGWITSDARVENHYLGYKFTSCISLKKISMCYISSNSTTYNATWKIQGSYDGSVWLDIGTINIVISGVTYTSDVYSDKYMKYFRISSASASGNSGMSEGIKLKLYGVDYSEREFEEDSTIHYIYDHGVELDTVNKRSDTDASSVSKEEDNLRINSSVANAGFYVDENLTNISVIRASLDDSEFAMFTNGILDAYDGSNNSYNSFTANNAPNNEYLDVTGMTGACTLFFQTLSATTTKVGINEWWLE